MPHTDSITCIDFVEKNGRMLILTSSSDCSVVLSDMNGNIYGTFGQSTQWRLDMDFSKTNENLQLNSDETNDKSQENTNTLYNECRIELNQNYEDLFLLTDEEMLTRRSNVWQSTSIGNRNKN